jgi:phage/plasmid-associated DNA primase
MSDTKVDLKSLHELQGYLDTNFPGCLIMPCRADKTPKYAHKDGQWTLEKCKGSMKECFEHGALILLNKNIIVVDIDEETWVSRMEEEFPMIKDTMICNTRKGKHYYFKRTEECDVANIYDSIRKMRIEGKVIPIDIKTIARTGTKTAISIPPSPNKSWVKQLGVDGDPLPIPFELIEFYKKHSTSPPPKSKQVSKKEPSNDTTEVVELVKLLSPSRADEYDDWMRVGWCLHNISTNYLNLWKEFSIQSSKYIEGECEQKWYSMSNEGLGIGSLHTWAKQDSPYEYKAFINSRVCTDIKTCNGSHNAVANIAYNILKGKYVCATANGKLWYEFNGTLWQEDKEGIHLRHELSTTVRDQFIFTVNGVTASLSIDELESNGSNTTRNANKQLYESLLRISFKLQDSGFKDSVVKEMREYFYDSEFMKKLDSNPNLLAFSNGVWELKEHRFRNATPDDYLSLNVGFAYTPCKNQKVYDQMKSYWKKLHPDHEQCEYVIKKFARQLQGDVGQNLFHIHAGFQGSAGNGKSTLFEILEMCLGLYIRKFGVEMLTAKQRVETGKPMPEFQYWKGIRILYCTEPKHDDILNTGIMKDLTGGEKIMYRLLFSNDVIDFRPQFKMHIMCNDAPQVDGSDSGVKRRIRKIDYMAQFVPQDQVDEEKHYYLRDDKFIGEMRGNPEVRMEFLRLLLDSYDHDFQYDMPEVIRHNSMMYLEENDNVFKFVNDYIVKDRDGYFTLKRAKDAFKGSEYYNGKIQTLKNDLQKLLKVVCIEQSRVNGKKEKLVFLGYRLKEGKEDDLDI